jgi:hypothetical protein
MRAYRIPVDFILRHIKPSWSDVDMGLRNGWLDSAGALEIAVQRIATNENAPHAEVMLAATELTEMAEISAQVEKLARSESLTDRERSKRRWLYLILAYLYENRGSVPDPLAEVEEIYSDFGYPEEVGRFVRYMPPKEHEHWPQPATQKETTERLIRVWADYVSRGLQDSPPDVRPPGAVLPPK